MELENIMVERLSLTVGSEELTFETGRIAKQAQGSVLLTCGETMVLSAVCASPEARPGQGFFPLTVDYREKSAAAGRIPGNYFRREARPTEREVLVCRLTDRPLRPLFPKGFLNEVQVCSNVFSADNENNPDVMSINGASAALHLSKIPFDGPIGAVRIGRIDGEFVVNPKMSQADESELDLVIAGTADAIMMVEGSALELSEELMVEALELGHAEIMKICAVIEQLREKAGVEKMPFDPPELDATVVADVEALAADRLGECFLIAEKHARQETTHALKDEVRETLAERYGEEKYAELAGDVGDAFEALSKRLMRQRILDEKTRVDGRKPDEIRQITIEVGLLPRAHGSCLFTRGETQAIVTTTLGTSRDEQRIDELTGDTFRRFMLHYNFPPWSVGEVRRMMGTSRREVGHGKLAERALQSILPFKEETESEELAVAENEPEIEDFPYTIRLLSDITESNGSSSMATVCGGSLALMDAGVPIAAPVSGIAMGLVKQDDNAVVLSDILGVEDHLGDMDFKVCGTRNGITSFQMDIKIKGITGHILTQALHQAREGRMHILDKMEACLSAPREEISPYAPRIYTLKIAVDQIRDVIGPGGKVVREIQAKTGADINIEDDGTINVAAVDAEAAEAAIEMIRSITAVPEIGQLHKGVISRIMGFGAFASIMGNKDGLIHKSELSIKRINRIEDAVNIGDEVDVKVIEIDDLGRINLSKVQAELELGIITEEEYKNREENAPPSRSPRDRGRDGGRGGGGRGGGGRDNRGGGGRGRR
jgi:polyribonucleotide nucleotidyltransferase